VIAKAGAAAVGAFDRSATAQSAVQSRAAAVGLFVGRKPVPALLARLRTHQLVPRDPSILSSISAVLNILGLGKQSLVVAKAADAMASAPAQAMGISGQAMLLNNEGHAMLLLRRWAAAELVLRKAVLLAPELSEAKINLALALLCQHEDEDAVKFYRLGQYRKPYDLVPGTDPASPSTPQADEVFDLSHGVDGTYPILRVPETWQETNGDTAIQQWNTAYQDWQNQFDVWHATQIQLHDEIDWAHIDPLTMQRYGSVMGAIYGSYLQPQFKPLYAAQQAASTALFDFLGGTRRSSATSRGPSPRGRSASSRVGRSRHVRRTGRRSARASTTPHRRCGSR
jgi:tetratricopeptide (TPR) repeat protein